MEELKKLTGKKNIIFMDKCRDAAELLMRYCQTKNYRTLILQEEGGWHTYEKSAKKIGMEVLFAKMNKGELKQKQFPFKEKSIIIINTNPGYLYVEPLSFYDEIKKQDTIIINDVSATIGDTIAKRGDFIIGSFGKDKPLTINAGGGFIAFNDEYDIEEILNLKKEYYGTSGENINFDELIKAINNLQNKKNKWLNHSNKLKKELKNQGFSIMNENESINILVKTNLEERENLIKFCKEHNLEYQNCPLYIRSMEDAVSIEIKRLAIK